MRQLKLLRALTILLPLTGCAIAPGLQTYDLPESGVHKTDQGSELAVVQLTQENIPAITATGSQHLNSVVHLFNRGQGTYRLSAGDVLSIQLWAYPEITPPIQDISNIKLQAIQSTPVETYNFL